MQINFEKNVVEFYPEDPEEKAKIETLWRMMIDCNGDAKKLVPIGDYEPQKNHKAAMFFIEGLEKKDEGPVEIRVDKDCICHCRNCNKQVSLKKGDPIPVCCGKVMEIID